LPRHGSVKEAGDPHLCGDKRDDRTGANSVGPEAGDSEAPPDHRPVELRCDPKQVTAKLNRTMIGWANYFCLGPVSKAYRAVERHSRKRLRQWLCAKHQISWQATRKFPDEM